MPRSLGESVRGRPKEAATGTALVPDSLVRRVEAHAAASVAVEQLAAVVARHSLAWVARKLGCDESTVRLWTLGRSRPARLLRARAEDELGIPGEAWDQMTEVTEMGNPEDWRGNVGSLTGRLVRLYLTNGEMVFARLVRVESEALVVVVRGQRQSLRYAFERVTGVFDGPPQEA